MMTKPGYIVMGEDGKEYGPNTPKQIRAWVAEERLEAKTPVKRTETDDWVFLGSLPEFADLFTPPPQRHRTPPRKGLVMTAIFVALVALAIFLLTHYKRH